MESSPKLESPTDSPLCEASTLLGPALSCSVAADGGASVSAGLVAEKTLLYVPVDEREEKVWLLVLQQGDNKKR